MVRSTLTGKLFLLAAVSLPTYAQKSDIYEPTYLTGPYNFSYGGKDITGPLYNQSATNPNVTRSVKFHPFWWYNGTNMTNKEIEWTWRVNISDFYASNAAPRSSELGVLENPHVVLNTYDFSWPGAKNLSAHLGSKDPLCISTGVAYTFPANVTNGYANGDTNSLDCGAALGDACRDAILRESSVSILNHGLCAREKPWNTLPECAGRIGLDEKVSRLPGSWRWNFNVANGSKTAPDRTDGRQIPHVPNPDSGSGLYAFNSWPRNATNLSEYYEATNRLHVVLIDMTDIGDGETRKPSLLCMRVNTTKVEDGSEEAKGKNDGKDKSAAHATGLNVAAMALAAATMMMAWAM
ncbi:hypothetical protein PG989_007432 [Apiospora arundinis]